MAASYTSVANLKTFMGVSDTNDDAAFTAVATAVNDMLEDYIGFAAADGGTAARSYDGDGTDELYIRGGIQDIASLAIKDETGGTSSTLASTEYVLKPYSHERPSGWPGWRIKLTDKATTYGIFTAGYETVVVTPTTGWGFSATPPLLSRIADILGARMFQSRKSGELLVVGSTDFGQAIVRFLPEPEYVAFLDKLRRTLGGGSVSG